MDAHISKNFDANTVGTKKRIAIINHLTDIIDMHLSIEYPKTMRSRTKGNI